MLAPEERSSDEEEDEASGAVTPLPALLGVAGREDDDVAMVPEAELAAAVEGAAVLGACACAC